jgi:hypothetical protein
MRDYGAELLHRTLQDFRTVFATLTPAEQSEALQCVLNGVTVHPGKLALEIFELGKFCPSSQKRQEWLQGLDSNLDNQLQRLPALPPLTPLTISTFVPLPLTSTGIAGSLAGRWPGG